MSYDVTVSTWHNITSNMAPFFTKFIGRPLKELDGIAAPDVDRLLTVALVRIAQTPTHELQEFDAANGWGDWENAARFLREVRDDCRRNPAEVVEVSS